MTTPNELYAALVARYGKDAVNVKLREMECRPFRGCVVLARDGGKSNMPILPDPVALCVLESVGEAMLWESDGTVITRHRDASLPFGVAEYGCYPKRVAATKSAAIIAACGGKE